MIPKIIKLIASISLFGYGVYQITETFIGNGIFLIILSILLVVLYFKNEVLIFAFLSLRKQDFDRTESTGELLFMIFFMIIIYNIFILIIPTIIYLATKSMNAFKISFFIICGFFAILVLAFFTDPENLIEILK